MAYGSPYYSDNGVTIYCADAREFTPEIHAEAIITDPVWPDCEHVFPGVDAPALLNEVLRSTTAQRVVVHLGNNSDPRFLAAVPGRFKFIRVCYLEYALVGYVGRILRDAEVAYAFGNPPASKPGARVIPGRVIATKADAGKGWSNKHRTVNGVAAAVQRLAHPAMRKLEHVRWLCKWFGGGSVLDPFMGSGTTAVACKILGIPFIGIEIEEKYCALAVERLRQESFNLTEEEDIA